MIKFCKPRLRLLQIDQLHHQDGLRWLGHMAIRVSIWKPTMQARRKIMPDGERSSTGQ